MAILGLIALVSKRRHRAHRKGLRALLIASMKAGRAAIWAPSKRAFGVRLKCWIGPRDCGSEGAGRLFAFRGMGAAGLFCYISFTGWRPVTCSLFAKWGARI